MFNTSTLTLVSALTVVTIFNKYNNKKGILIYDNFAVRGFLFI